MKTAISLPDDVFRAVEAEAKRLNVSRSEFFARAAMRLLEDLESERVKISYDEAFAEQESKDASFRRRVARASLLGVEWKEA
jgi:metal-responsive CopG/Arc/MetJ family transcriptional regulator